MTKLKQSLRKAPKNSTMTYLTDKLPDPVTVSLEKVVALLNQKEGVRTARGNPFNYNTVVNIYYGKYADYKDYVRTGLSELVLTHSAKKRDVQVHLDAIFNAVATV